MAASMFNLGKVAYKRTDGEGETLEAYNSPSAQVLATRRAGGNSFLLGMYMAYYSARNAGLFDAMGFEPEGDDDEDTIRLFYDYSFDLVLLDDDGKPRGDSEDWGNPTTAS